MVLTSSHTTLSRYRRPLRRMTPFSGFGNAGVWRPGDRPPQHLAPFTGPKHTLTSMEDKALGPRGEQSHLVRQFTEEVVRYLEPKDYLKFPHY